VTINTSVQELAGRVDPFGDAPLTPLMRRGDSFADVAFPFDLDDLRGRDVNVFYANEAVHIVSYLQRIFVTAWISSPGMNESGTYPFSPGASTGRGAAFTYIRRVVWVGDWAPQLPSCNWATSNTEVLTEPFTRVTYQLHESVPVAEAQPLHIEIPEENTAEGSYGKTRSSYITPSTPILPGIERFIALGSKIIVTSP